MLTVSSCTCCVCLQYRTHSVLEKHSIELQPCALFDGQRQHNSRPSYTIRVLKMYCQNHWRIHRRMSLRDIRQSNSLLQNYQNMRIRLRHRILAAMRQWQNETTEPWMQRFESQRNTCSCCVKRVTCKRGATWYSISFWFLSTEWNVLTEFERLRMFRGHRIDQIFTSNDHLNRDVVKFINQQTEEIKSILNRLESQNEVYRNVATKLSQMTKDIALKSGSDTSSQILIKWCSEQNV